MLAKLRLQPIFSNKVFNSQSAGNGLSSQRMGEGAAIQKDPNQQLTQFQKRKETQDSLNLEGNKEVQKTLSALSGAGIYLIIGIAYLATIVGWAQGMFSKATKIINHSPSLDKSRITNREPMKNSNITR
jgi:hypothetical protein